MSEEVIELSVEDTNKLRAELGLAPLRMTQAAPQEPWTHSAPGDGGDEVLDMSVEDTNALREKLGLPPLRTSSKKEIHKPAENDREASEAAERIQQARLRRELESQTKTTFGESTLADEADDSALSWAEQMRKKKAEEKKAKPSKSTKKVGDRTAYDEKDLEGMQVAHNLNDLEVGATTVFTLADAPLLSESLDNETARKSIGLNENDVALENVNLSENKRQEDGLRKKRLLEMGMGRAGGYAGFDDEEFEELGGTLGPSKRERGNALLGDDMDKEKVSQGFRIGSKNANQDSSLTDLDKIQMGKAISLVPEKADVAASDYMTLEEEEAERAARKKNKDGKFKKKKKKKDKKRRKTQIESDDEDGDVEENAGVNDNARGLLEQLQESAIPESSGLRKRHRSDDDDEDHQYSVPESGGDMQMPPLKSENKRAKYDAIMAKGNERTKQAFEAKTNKPKPVEDPLDDEPDDSFLNAALAKARRLNRLRDLNKATTGAEAVADAVKSISKDSQNESSVSKGITFCIDDTREFTLALETREQQKERDAEKAKQQRLQAKANQIVKKEKEEQLPAGEEKKVETVEEEEDVDMEELAKDVKNDDLDDNGFEASSSRSAGVGRGLSSFITMLKTTGEISDKNAREELKGRAKDERNYDNYAPMDLSKVVKVGRNATDKDRELASREIKLEYRDKHGRLLTTKEAFRDLCYQFHGHGASKKKEEKRQKQIEREQAQSRMASQQVASARDGTTGGTLGALRATQKATGKAFIVHKTS